MKFFTPARLISVALLLALAGCGMRFDTRAPWRDELEAKCLSSGAVQTSAYIEPATRIDGPGACGMQQPFKVAAFANGTVGLTSRATMSCSAISSVDRWVKEIVEPAAQLYYGQRIEAMTVGSYSCRNQDSKWFARISEHSFGNAVDIMGFRFANGRKISVREAWRGSATDQAFLREITVNACDYFTTVLAPGSDSYHADHLHLDLMRHDTGYQKRICQPKLNFARRIKAPATANQIAGLNYRPTASDQNATAVAEMNAPSGLPVTVPVPAARPIDPKVIALLPPEPESDDDGDFKGVY